MKSRWRGIVNRCRNRNSPRFKDYGGRGISICDEWANDRMAFVRWALENGFRPGLQIDRIDNDGNYEPANCRFVTASENSKNRRDTIRVFGVCFKDMCDKNGIALSTALDRVHKWGWKPERACTVPVGMRRPFACYSRGAKGGCHFGKEGMKDVHFPRCPFSTDEEMMACENFNEYKETVR